MTRNDEAVLEDEPAREQRARARFLFFGRSRERDELLDAIENLVVHESHSYTTSAVGLKQLVGQFVSGSKKLKRVHTKHARRLAKAHDVDLRDTRLSA